MTSELVNADKNIYFVQLGINQRGLPPLGCAIDHDVIDWDAYDLTGGFGEGHITLSYDDNSYFGVNFFKADNSTPLGLHDTCPSTSSTSYDDYIYSGGLWTYIYAVQDDTFYKTIFGAWWADTDYMIAS